MTSLEQGKTEQPSFFARVKAELVKLFTHAPGWEASAAATLTYIAPMVELVATFVDPGATVAVCTVLAKIQSAMAAAAVVIKAAGPTPTLITYLNAIINDLAEIEALAQVKDPATASKLEALVTAITQEVNAIHLEISGAN